MEVDIRTIALILGVTHLMQVLVFFHQYKVNKAYKGIGWWLMWSAAEVIGFIFILLRGIPALLNTAIIVQNVAILAGTIFIYIGVMRFFNKKENLKIIIPFFAVYVIALFYLLFIYDNIQLRSGITSIAYVFISFLTAYSLYKNKTRSISATANFNIIIFIVHGGIFLYRTIMIFSGASVSDIFTPSLFNFLPYFDALIVSLLWTFGFVIMVNQRLNSEMTEAKTHFEQIFSTSPDAAIITRLSDGMFVDCNEGYTRISGYTKEDMRGKTSLEINIWKNPEGRKEVLRRMKENGFCENYESIFLRKDGTEITGLMSAKSISLQGVPHIISITRDITERKQIQDKIRNSENKFRSLFENMAEGVALHEVIYDENENPIDYRILDINKAYENNTGLIAKEVRGKLSREVYKTDIPPYLKEFTDVPKSGKPYFFETYFPPLQKHFSISVISPAKGQFATVFLDVTQQRKLEKEKQLFGNVLEQSLNEIYIFDINTFKFLTVNKGAVENIGYTIEELNQMTPLDLKPQYTLAMFKEIIRPLVENTAKIITFNTNHRRKDGTTYPVEVHLSISHKENVFTAIILDITERKQKEEELKVNEEKFRRFFESTPLPLCYVNKDGVIILRNERFVKVFGYTDVEVPSLKEWWLKAYPEAKYREWVVQNWETAVKRASETGADIKSEIYKVTCKDGTVRDIIISGITINDNFLATFVDFTERKQAEELRQEIQNRLVEAQTVAHLGSWEWDIVKDEIRGSEEFYSLLDVQPEEIFRFAQFTGRLHPDDIDNVNREVSDAIKQNFPYDTDYRVKQSDGSWRYLNAKGKVIKDADGNPIRMVGTCLDITERKQAEEILMQEQELYIDLVKSMPTGVYRVRIFPPEKWKKNAWNNSENTPYSMELVSERFCEILGVSKETYTKNPGILNDLVHPEEKAGFAKVHEDAMSSLNKFSWDGRIVNDGKIRWVHFESLPRVLENSDVIWTGSVQDITERKQADENLQASEERFRRAVVDSPFPILIHAEDGAILQASNSWCEITGYTRDELATIADWTERAYGERRSLVQEDIDRLYGLKHRVAEGDYTVRTKSGESRIWEFSSAPLGKLKDGRRTVMSMAIDVTDRRLAEEEIRKLNEELEHRVVERTAQLAKSEKLLSETGRLARVGGWEIDLITGKNLWSETTYKIHEVESGFDPNLDTAIHFYSPESLPIISECVDRLIKLGEPFDKELVLITAKKNRIWVRAIGEAYRENGNIVKIGGIFQDINERKIAEQERELLLQKIQNNSALLESANKELEAFSYSVSHDLRAPLRHISGFIELLIDNNSPQLDEKGLKHLNTISRASVEMGNLIDSLLIFSRLSKTEVKKTKINSGNLINRIIKTFSDEIAGRDIEINISELPDIKGDETLINQVWVNLISNAIKFTRNKEKAVIEIGGKTENGETIFYIKDNGAGFDMKYADKLFGVFQRLHKASEFEGIGIGLANVNRIVTRHKGKCRAESEVGKGATFFFNIPNN